MNATEASELVALMALYDNRRASDPDVVAWLKVIGDLDYADCETAVLAHYREARERIMPADVRQRVKALRRDRLAREVIPAPPADPARFRAGLQDTIRQIGDGFGRHLAIAGPVREGPPPEEFTEAREKLGPAVPPSKQDIARQQAAESRAERAKRDAIEPPGETA